MQSETGFPSSHQLKSYVAFKSRLKLAARAVLSADAGLLVLLAIAPASWSQTLYHMRMHMSMSVCICCKLATGVEGVQVQRAAIMVAWPTEPAVVDAV